MYLFLGYQLQRVISRVLYEVYIYIYMIILRFLNVDDLVQEVSNKQCWGSCIILNVVFGQ